MHNNVHLMFIDKFRFHYYQKKVMKWVVFNNAVEWKSTLLGSLHLEWKSTLKIVESTPK